MVARINREEFLRALESVEPGLSPRAIVEQSDCVILQDGQFITYNDEVACSIPSGLGEEFIGAVSAKELITLLRKLSVDEIGVEMGDGQLIVKTFKGRESSGIVMQKEILLPVSALEKPKKWSSLHDKFCEAVGVVHQCTGRDESYQAITCVHIHPKWIEATDNFQICRWRLDTGVKESRYIKKDAIRHVVTAGVNEFTETDHWIHFKNPRGLVISCRHYMEDFPPVGKILKIIEGVPTVFPKSLKETCQKADIFSSQNTENNQVKINLQPEKMTLKGEGVNGWYRKEYKIAYTGDPIEFLISPQLLIDLVGRHNEMLVSPTKMRVETSEYIYVTALTQPSDNGHSEEEATPRKKKREKVEAVASDA